MQYKRLKPSSVSWKPYPYQKRAVKFLLEHAAAALFLEPGLGKTSITLAALKILLKKGLVSKVLVLAPLRVATSTWPAEVTKWSDFEDTIKLKVLHGKFKDEDLEDEDANVFVLNYEGLPWLTKAETVRTGGGTTGKKKRMKVVLDMKRWRKLGFDMVVYDELSKLKHTSSVRHKIIAEILPTFGRRWGLTGSPASNGLMDLFGQCYVLDEGATLGKYITHYRMAYFENPPGNPWVWRLRQGMDAAIHKQLKKLALSMQAQDYLDMPDAVIHDIFVDLPADARKLYDTLEDDLLVKFEEGLVTAATAGIASAKCRQVASGAVYVDPEVVALIKLPKAKRQVARIHDAKIEALRDLVDELQGEPVLVAYEFNHDLERLREEFGADVPNLGTGTTVKQQNEIIARWNKGEIPVLLAHPASAGYGLNLQGSCKHVAFFTVPWDFELYDQFIRRVWRQGNKHKKVFIHRILAYDTLDSLRVPKALNSKAMTQTALYNALKKRASDRK